MGPPAGKPYSLNNRKSFSRLRSSDSPNEGPTYSEVAKADMDDSPIEEVRLTVPATDDSSLPVLTFRTWTLGLASCAILAFQKQLFFYHQNQISISPSCAQLVLLPAGRWMAANIPDKPIKIPGTTWSFTMNPGPFNIKEHVAVSVFASCGLARPYASRIISQMMAFYHRKIRPLAALLLIATSQLIGYGFAGLVMKFLVDSPHMWWPETLVYVSTYRALHEVEARPKGQLSRFQFFMTVFILSFSYYIVPIYFFPSISALSVVCWIWKKSITAHQIGGGYNGLGLGSFGLDWSAISGGLGSPLANPSKTILNSMLGFVIFLYVITPIAYWTNTYEARRFPMFSPELFDKNGQQYNVSRILDARKFEFNEEAYREYSPMYMSIVMAFHYGFSFASATATITHVVLYDGRSIWKQFKGAHSDVKKTSDAHGRLMKENYDQIPTWWFLSILFAMIGLSMVTVQGFEELQLPYWGVLLACVLVLFCILPNGVIQATTNQGLSVSEVFELLIGYLYPGNPAAIITFKSYSVMSLYQALLFLSDFKFGYYMKIPPKSMFVVQVVGTILSSCVNFATEWWLFSTVKNICDPEKLPKGSPWTCPGENAIHTSFNIWGLVGPARTFAPHGIYSNLYLFFLVGMLATVLVWAASIYLPQIWWFKLINVPLVLGAAKMMPIVKPVTYWSWLLVAIFFNVFLYKRYKSWWARHNYLLSSGLDAGVAFMALLCSILQHQGFYGINWWGLEVDDHCPLARCPTAPNIKVDGCPELVTDINFSNRS